MILTRKDIKKIGFTAENIYLQTTDGREKTMPLRWFPRLENATETERLDFKLSPTGIHWEALDEDLSYNGFFTYDKDKIEKEKSEAQRILSALPFLNIEEVSKIAGISPILMRHYACGVKKPSKKRTELIKKTLREVSNRILEAV